MLSSDDIHLCIYMHIEMTNDVKYFNWNNNQILITNNWIIKFR